MSFDSDAEKQLDLICLEYEDRLGGGSSPQIEDYLNRVPPPLRSRLLSELLYLEGDYASETPDLEAIVRRFPEYEQTIRDCLATQDQRTPLKAGERIGRYVVRKRIGCGTFGQVYEAWDEVLQRRVALKSPRRPDRVTRDHLERFLQEARSLAKLRHPNILAIHDILCDDRDWPLLVLEYVDAQPLDATSERSEVIGHLIHVAYAMDYVHRQGFVHRDLKPENILIEEGGRTVVADFGLSAHADMLGTQTGQAVGTPKYMSPELVSGHSHWVDGRSDIWSIGVILYEAITGDCPFEADSLEGIADGILTKSVRPPRQIENNCSKELEQITLKCLCRSPENRYSTARDLARALERHQRGSHAAQRLDQRVIGWGVAVVCLLVFSLFWRLADPPAMTGHIDATQVIATAVQVMVIREGDLLELGEAIPMQTNDWMEIQIRSNRPTRFWAYWIDVDASVWQLYPKLGPQEQAAQLRPLSVTHGAVVETMIPPDWQLSDTTTGTATLLILGADPNADISPDVVFELKKWQVQSQPVSHGLRFDFGKRSQFIGRGLEHNTAPEFEIETAVAENQQILGSPAFEAFSVCRAFCIPIRGSPL